MLLPTSTRDLADEFVGLERSFWDVAKEIEERVGTPFYAYFPQRAATGFEAMVAGAAVWGQVRVAFSVKTNPLAALLQDLERRGAYAEVVSEWEFSQARAAGFSPDRIVFNGPHKPDAELRRVLATPPFTINIDSLDELDVLERNLGYASGAVAVGLRICPPRARGSLSRFGLEFETGEVHTGIVRCLNNPSLQLRCIHFHLGTQVQDGERYAEVVRIAQRMWRDHGFANDVCLDIGGGFPYDHARTFEGQPLVLGRFFAALASAWGTGPRPPLLIEPGRIIAAPTMAVVSRVLARKPRSNEPTIIVLDSGTNHNVMAAFYEHAWSYAAAGLDAGHRLCGPLCMEDDNLSGLRNAPLPELGALVATLNAGAYSLALARTFIQPRPPIFRINPNGSYEQLEGRETRGQAYACGSSSAMLP